MDATMLVAVFCIAIVGMLIYSLYQIQGKIWCTFRRPNKTKVEKWVPMKSRYVHFDKGRYNVNTKRITLLRWKRGIFQFFPIFVPSLDFSWDSSNPHDPETFQNTWDTPEAREAAGQEDNYKAFNKGLQVQAGSKSRFPEWLFPAITIGAVLIIGYLVYQQGQHLTYLEQLIKMGLQ